MYPRYRLRRRVDNPAHNAARQRYATHIRGHTPSPLKLLIIIIDRHNTIDIQLLLLLQNAVLRWICITGMAVKPESRRPTNILFGYNLIDDCRNVRYTMIL